MDEEKCKVATVMSPIVPKATEAVSWRAVVLCAVVGGILGAIFFWYLGDIDALGNEGRLMAIGTVSTGAIFGIVLATTGRTGRFAFFGSLIGAGLGFGDLAEPKNANFFAFMAIVIGCTVLGVVIGMLIGKQKGVL